MTFLYESEVMEKYIMDVNTASSIWRYSLLDFTKDKTTKIFMK